MATSRVPATIDALVSRFAAAGLNVYDGPVVSGDYSAAVFVGYDGGGQDSELRSASETQSWAGLGAKARNSEFDILCGVAAIDGGNSASTARGIAYGLLAEAETALRADPSLGQAPPFVAEMLSGDLFTEPTKAGMQCRITFAVRVKTRV